MFPIVEAWRDSGLSKRAFCEERGIEKSAFSYWSKRYKEGNHTGGFIPISFNGPDEDKQFIEIQYPNGIVLRLPANTPASLVRQYVGQ